MDRQSYMIDCSLSFNVAPPLVLLW